MNTGLLSLFAPFLLLGAQVAGAQTTASERVLVVPFENSQREARVGWLGEAAAVLLADELNARGVPAIRRAERVHAFRQLHLPLSASLSRATVIKVGELVGASEVVVGSYRIDGDQLFVEAHSIRIDVGRLQPDVVERSSLGDLFTVFQRVAARLSPGGVPPSTAAGPSPPPGAFESYIKGLLAEHAAMQATFLEAALREYPGFDRAKLALWEVRHEHGDHAAALSVARSVAASSSLAAGARFRAGVSLIELKRYDEAFDTFKALLDEAPAPAASAGRQAAPVAPILNNLGAILIRRGATPQTGSPAYYLTKAADADPGEADYRFNLGYAYALAQNHQGAVYWLRECVRRNPADADAHFVLAAALQASGSPVEAARERELARQLSAEYETQGGVERPVPAGLERVRTELETPRDLRLDQAIVNSAQREHQDLAVFHLNRGRRFFEQEQDRDAMAELRRTVYLLPYEAEAHRLIGRIHLRAGRPQDAVDALKISIWSQDTAAARVTLAGAYISMKNTTAARAELERALALDPASSEAKRLLGALK